MDDDFLMPFGDMSGDRSSDESSASKIEEQMKKGVVFGITTSDVGSEYLNYITEKYSDNEMDR